jgi:thymidylate synthase ThyX
MDTRILELKHVTRDLPGGGIVLVLNTGALIPPEAEAMLQALHSRSIGGIRAHLKVLAEKGFEKFMQTFFVGYGHKSIGDCGHGTIFVEGVSMLVAKAIQDWMLYAGQESSTRYLDFSTQKFIDPADRSDLLEELRQFYLKAQEPVRAHLREQFPPGETEKADIYEKAIKARAFDITRGFLPAGASTNLSWHTNLRQAADKLGYIRHHPLEEVRIVAQAIEEALKEAFPSSFGGKRYEVTECYHRDWMEEEYYFAPVPPWPLFALEHSGVDRRLLQHYERFLRERPEKTELPKVIGETGMIQYAFLLDFASFRDVQRQRAVYQRMPRLTLDYGFEPWYLEELPAGLRDDAQALLLHNKIIVADIAQEHQQYYIPMGYRTPNRITGDLPALVYLAELRSGSAVHPTLQKRARQIGTSLEALFEVFGLRLQIDETLTRFDVKRGTHDIIRKD